jgi:hypothetical protein
VAVPNPISDQVRPPSYPAAAALCASLLLPACGGPSDEREPVRFEMALNAGVIDQLVEQPAERAQWPRVEVAVIPGAEADLLVLRGSNLRPWTVLELHTVENSAALSDDLGLSFQETTSIVGSDGRLDVMVEKQLLNQVLLSDPEHRVAPVALHHLALRLPGGPAALSTVPDPDTGLGPLCTQPDPDRRAACLPDESR